MTDIHASLQWKNAEPRAHSIARSANSVTLPNVQNRAYSISAESAEADHDVLLDKVENALAFGFRR